MLENINDYIALLSIVGILLVALGIGGYFTNLKQIDKNLRKEVKYYDYDPKK